MMIKTNINEMDFKDLKKQAWAITPIMRMMMATKNDTQFQSLDGKKTCNNKTPP